MTKKQSIMLAVAGAALMATTQAYAGNSTLVYSDNDLLVNFRNAAAAATYDVTVDFGNVNTFVTTVAGLTGQTAVLDSGTGYNLSSYTTQFNGADLLSKDNQDGSGTADDIAMSAASANSGTSTLWLTRQISASQLLSGGPGSPQQGSAAQAATANVIGAVGLGAEKPTSGGSGFQLGTSANAAYVKEGSGNSFYDNAVNGTSGLLDYATSQNPTAPAPLEATPVNGTVYEALWKVPVGTTGSTAGDMYEGYFTFDQNGEVDFTAVSAVPEPSTYALFAAGGLLALALRRQFRALTA